LAGDVYLKGWYEDFFKQAKDYYAERLHTMKNSSDVFC